MTPEMPLFRTLQWGWFGAAMFYSYGEFAKAFANEHKEMFWVHQSLRYHTLASFGLLSVLVVASILSLRADSVRFVRLATRVR